MAKMASYISIPIYSLLCAQETMPHHKDLSWGRAAAQELPFSRSHHSLHNSGSRCSAFREDETTSSRRTLGGSQHWKSGPDVHAVSWRYCLHFQIWLNPASGTGVAILTYCFQMGSPRDQIFASGASEEQWCNADFPLPKNQENRKIKKKIISLFSLEVISPVYLTFLLLKSLFPLEGAI